MAPTTAHARRPTLGVVMDPIESIKIHKDSSFALLLAAQRRGWRLKYIEMHDLYLRDGAAYARQAALRVEDDPRRWFDLEPPEDAPLGDLDAVLMRKDPPVDTEYHYATHILEHAEQAGVLVVNRAAGLRNYNEKLAALRFPHCCAPSLVSRDPARLRAYLQTEPDLILKPLDAMGGAGVFRVRKDDPNTSVILETLTDNGRRQIMAQRYIPEIRHGDKRILLVNGQPAPYALARIPAKGETRGNLAAGGTGVGTPLSERDRWICDQVGPTLVKDGLWFVGLDVIGDYLTEINVTSPTCIRELDREYGLDIAGDLIQVMEERLGVGRN